MKIKLILDYDNTIVNSTKAFCESYNHLYKNELGFVPANWIESKEYNFIDVCPLLNGDVKKVRAIFESNVFFKFVQFMDDETFKSLQILNDIYDIYICTIGTRKNIYLKHKWLMKNLPFLNHLVFISNSDLHMDKSIINMEDSIFIDDHSGNLDSSNASIKISFGKRYAYNNMWSSNICETWHDVIKSLT
jgi:hypothetical protein